jgi:aspartate/methionine/tyrosine aminotransferase
MSSERTVLAARVERLQLPERSSQIGMSVGDAERELAILDAGPGMINLTYANTHRFPPPKWTEKTFADAAAGGGLTYTPYRGDVSVREQLAPSLTEFLGIDVDPTEHLVLTPGTQGALYAALAAIINPGDVVLLPDPDYLSTERTVRMLGGTVHPIPLFVGEDDAYLDLDALDRAMRLRPRVMVFSNPNNPTGYVYDEATIARIAALAAQYDVLLIADQLYSRLVYDGHPFHHLVAAPETFERTITLLGPSKTESLSGYRLGCLVAPPKLAQAVEDIQSVTALRAPAYAQHLLARWLRDDTDYLNERIREYQALRDTAVAALRSRPYLDVFSAGGTSYLFPRFRSVQPPDQEVASRLLKDAGLIINPGYQFGVGGVGAFRICFAQSEDELDDALSRMLTCLDQLVAHQ